MGLEEQEGRGTTGGVCKSWTGTPISIMYGIVPGVRAIRVKRMAHRAIRTK